MLCSVLSAFPVLGATAVSFARPGCPQCNRCNAESPRKGGQKQRNGGLEGQRAKEKKKEELLLDHSSVSSFNALLLAAVCSQTQVPLSISWGSSPDTCLPYHEESQMMSLASPSSLQELELVLPWISRCSPALFMQLGSKEAQGFWHLQENPGACSPQLTEVAQNSPLWTSTAFTLQNAWNRQGERVKSPDFYINLSLSWTLLLRFREPSTAGLGGHTDLALFSCQQISSIPVPTIWEEIRKHERKNILLLRSLGFCYHLDCSHGGNTVWFQIRKLVSSCSGDSHCHHPRPEQTGYLLCLWNSQKTAADKTIQPVHLILAKSL